jgi:hypothetical protein
MAKASSTPKKQIVTEDSIIDFVFQRLYTNLHVNEMHFDNDIITPSGLQLDAVQKEHLRELVVNTGLVNSSVGFKKNGFMYLNQSGIQVMKQYKSYTSFMAAGRQGIQPAIQVVPPKAIKKTKTATNKTKVKAKKKS